MLRARLLLDITPFVTRNRLRGWKTHRNLLLCGRCRCGSKAKKRLPEGGPAVHGVSLHGVSGIPQEARAFARGLRFHRLREILSGKRSAAFGRGGVGGFASVCLRAARPSAAVLGLEWGNCGQGWSLGPVYGINRPLRKEPRRHTFAFEKVGMSRFLLL